MDVLLGIDIGTTHCKVAVYSVEGELVALSRRRTPTERPKPGWAEHPGSQLWSAITDAIREVISCLPAGATILAVGVAGMAEAGLLITRDGHPLTPIIAWYDRRAEEYLAGWNRLEVADEVYRITGLVPSTKVPVAKLQWLRDYRPDVLEKACKWLHVPDFIAFQLTGVAATDYSLAGRTMAFDITRREWARWILSSAQLPADLWPSVHRATSPVGQVTPSASAITGLPAGIPVVIAGHDHLCGAAAVGILSPGKTLNSLGTAESLITVLESLPQQRDRMEGHNFGCHVVPGKYYVLAGLSGAGATLEWWMDWLSNCNFAFSQSKQQGDSVSDRIDSSLRYKRLMEVLATAPEGPTGVLFFPYLRGSAPPGKDPLATASLMGITENLAVGQLLKAMLEGLACEFRRMLEGMPVPVSDGVTTIGGGAENPVWLRLHADIGQRVINVPRIGEAVAAGAALLAGVGAGVYSDVGDGSSQFVKSWRRIEPEEASSQEYDLWYRNVYLPAWKCLHDLEPVMRSFRKH